MKRKKKLIESLKFAEVSKGIGLGSLSGSNVLAPPKHQYILPISLVARTLLQ